MDYAEYRKLAAARAVNEDKHDFSWELEHIPTVHSGFLQSLNGDDSKSVLRLTYYYSKGSYHCLLLDRSAREKAFINVGTLGEGLAIVEEAMKNNTLEWMTDKYAS